MLFIYKTQPPQQTLEMLVSYNSCRSDFEGLNSAPPKKDML